MTENENNDKRFKQEADDKKETEEPEPVDYKSVDYGEGYAQQKIDELTKLLEKEKEKSLRLLADYQNLEKQTVDRINAREDKIILDFLTIYEDFLRAKNAYEGESRNVDSLNSIIKNMEAILDHYEVKPIEVKGKKLDPKLHEVVQEVEDPNHEEGAIVKEIAKGYIIRGEVMKYSKVCVSKKIKE